jgi:DNA-binding transcriptional LysR family regulator
MSNRRRAGAAGLLDQNSKVHNDRMFDWNDLKYLLAVARHQSTIAAGKALGISQSTVHRRLTELERRLGRDLVTRHASGYRLTEFGQQLLPLAERIEAGIQDLERQVTGAANDVSGVIRVTCPEPIVLKLTQSGFFDRFHARHPQLRIQLLTSDRYLDLAKGEADVALRSGDTEDDLVGRKIADSIWGLYGSRIYVEKHGKPQRVDELSSHALVGFEESLSNHRAAKWLQQVAPNTKLAARNNSVLGILYAVKAGVGLGPLPIPIADAEQELVRVFAPVTELTRSWRVLAHVDLRRTPRVAAFFDFIMDERENLKPILTG